MNSQSEIAAGFCQCGCGERTRIATKTDRRAGQVRGQPLKFYASHVMRRLHFSGDQHPKWKGGRHRKERGYVLVWAPEHEHANGQGYVYEHVLIAARAHGKPLPAGTEVHHGNEVKGDNRNENLVICQDRAYHSLLHVRRRALLACGNPGWRKCRICGAWDDPQRLSVKRYRGNLADIYHRECFNAHRHPRGKSPC